MFESIVILLAIAIGVGAWMLTHNVWATVGAEFLGLGIATGIIGFILNVSTPYQQPGPIIGGVMALFGLIILLIVY